jgi:hypothetical protein
VISLTTSSAAGQSAYRPLDVGEHDELLGPSATASAAAAVSALTL